MVSASRTSSPRVKGNTQNIKGSGLCIGWVVFVGCGVGDKSTKKNVLTLKSKNKIC